MLSCFKGYTAENILFYSSLSRGITGEAAPLPLFPCKFVRLLSLDQTQGEIVFLVFQTWRKRNRFLQAWENKAWNEILKWPAFGHISEDPPLSECCNLGRIVGHWWNPAQLPTCLSLSSSIVLNVSLLRATFLLLQNVHDVWYYFKILPSYDDFFPNACVSAYIDTDTCIMHAC